MRTIELHLPDDLADKVNQLTSNAETYIISMLLAKVKELDSPKTLADEYRMAASENRVIMKDFAHSDLEGWDDDY